MTATVLVPEWSPADVDAAVLWAESGAAWLTDRQASVPVGLVRGVAGLTEFLDRRGTGISNLVPAHGLGLLSERAAMLRFGPASRESCGGGTRLLRCSDGWLALTLARVDDHMSVPAWLEVDIDGLGLMDTWSVVEATVAARTRAELVERGELLGLGCAAVNETDRDLGVQLTHLGSSPGRSISGATVINMAALWAGPLCGDLLARAGARLITVESTHRPDGARARPQFFAALHGQSGSIALDLRTNDGRAQLADLLSTADIVLEGSRPRALEQMGISARTVTSTGPRVWLSITGHGRAQAHRVGFGDDAAAAGGLVAWVEDEPRFIADAIADPLTGIVAAATAIQLIEAGDHWIADIALSHVARSFASPWSKLNRKFHPSPPVPRSDPGKAMPLGHDNARLLS